MIQAYPRPYPAPVVGNTQQADPVERYRKFEEDEFLLEDAPHVGEDD